MSSDNNTMSVLLANEAELLVESLDATTIEQVGNKRWWTRHEIIEKLNMQAIVNVTSNHDEFIKDFLISLNKVNTLVHELLVSELWTEKIFPIIKTNIDSSNGSSLPIYMALFHQASVVSLLETGVYYKEFCEALGDNVIDVIDFVNRKIVKLVVDNFGEVERRRRKKLVEEEEREELARQQQTIEFTICMKCLSILRYISDCIEEIPLSALTRLLDTHDFACLLVQILDRKPWKRNIDGGKTEFFDNNKWIGVKPDEEKLISKLEGQVWLTLYQLLMHPEAQQKYEYNSYRKGEIMKLRKYFNEMFLDQLPHLKTLQLFIEHLGVMETPPVKQSLIIEQLPEIRKKLEHKYQGKWEAIATRQLKENFSLNEKQMKEQADRLASTYNLDVLESFLDEPPVCAGCQGEAMKRCSRCRNEWYCSRPCQVKHWSKHKALCNMFVQVKEDAK